MLKKYHLMVLVSDNWPACHIELINVCIMYGFMVISKPICDWICKKGSYTRNYEYLEIQF